MLLKETPQIDRPLVSGEAGNHQKPCARLSNDQVAGLVSKNAYEAKMSLQADHGTHEGPELSAFTVHFLAGEAADADLLDLC